MVNPGKTIVISINKTNYRKIQVTFFIVLFVLEFC